MIFKAQLQNAKKPRNHHLLREKTLLRKSVVLIPLRGLIHLLLMKILQKIVLNQSARNQLLINHVLETESVHVQSHRKGLDQGPLGPDLDHVKDLDQDHPEGLVQETDSIEEVTTTINATGVEDSVILPKIVDYLDETKNATVAVS